ncbi:N-acetylglucosamine kinase [Solibacillus sp. R5-41]|uniref:N-acetylglucosamine kinase n=1 Tax=Solibacillus sp. R5-41 TaxID=2048654 RepID=UPI000C124E76|nr:BadF/BadG/BcrA/BcrD ATPase family protein [Solibacillus sp. R5-41]ATP38659.1 N-acetylglucosamine kinase [Solibacillus sp. R5-41]
MSNQYILAVDGGATKTTMSIRTADGRELFSATSTGSNYQAVGVESVQHVLIGLMRSAAAHLPAIHLDVAVFAMAGIDTNRDKIILEEIIEQSITRSSFTCGTIIIENDVEATLKGLCEENATLLISGTGAICYSVVGQATFRAGGWGHRVGDEGSGYWIGKHIAKAIFRTVDGRNEPTALTKLILEAYKLEDSDALLNWIYSEEYTNTQLANLASFLQQAVDQHDNIAKKIAEQAVLELFLLSTTVLKKANYTHGYHLFFLNGGVLKNNKFILNLLKEKLTTEYPQLMIQMCEEKPIEAIVKRALSALKAPKNP